MRRDAMSPLLEQLLSRLPKEKAAAVRGRSAELAALLEGRRAEAFTAHGDVGVAPDEWVDALAARLGTYRDALEGLSAIRAADVLLVCGCLRGDRVALDRFDAMLRGEVRAAAATTRSAADQADSVLQDLRAHLLAGKDGPALAQYGAKGALQGFLRISAVRELINVHERHRREAPVEQLELAEAGGAIDPELQQFKLRYRDDFAACFREALSGLTPRERSLLRLSAFEKLSIDKIGALFDVHRATAARWLEGIKTRLAERTEELLAARLGVGESEVISVIRLVRSEVDVSLQRMLASKEGDQPR